MKALAEYEKRHGKAVLQKVEPPTAAPHSVDTKPASKSDAGAERKPEPAATD